MATLLGADERFEAHQEVYVLHPTESWVRGVVGEVVEVPTRGGHTETRYSVTITLDAVNLPGISAANARLEKLPAAALHHVVQQSSSSGGGGGVSDHDGGSDWGSGLTPRESGGSSGGGSTTDDDADFHDLLHMSYLHDSTLLNQVRKRYFRNLIYTHIGPIVLALNPYDFTLSNYVDANMPKYIAEGDVVLRSGSVNLPHAWSTAHLAYHSMLSGGVNQSVIVSGESGAGKTETAKIVVKYLGFVSTANANEDEKAEAASVTRRVNLTSPILEAFGNAKTRFNDNSSRFGKFMKVQFSRGVSGVMVGAAMEVYLLEKSRIVTHGPEERGYHSFYQLAAAHRGADASAAAAKESLKASLSLGDATEYPSLNVGKATVIPGVDDARDFDEVCAAMNAVGLASAEQDSVWRVVAGVLHALKLSFEAVSADESRLSDASRAAELQLLAKLWKIDTDKFVRELTTTTTTVRSDTFVRTLRASEAVDYRDSICKTLYESLFLWLVARINDLIAPSGGTSARWIALLDIFGFENFAHGNRFEQLCINLANETLQNHYNSIIFTRDMEECRAEAINTESVSFYDNQPCLDLICGFNFALCGPNSAGKTTTRVSILSLLDEESLLAKGSDVSFCEKLGDNFMQGYGSNSPGKPPATPVTPVTPATPGGTAVVLRSGNPNVFEHDGHPNFMKPKTSRNTFVIRHYAGDVTYTVDGFKARNLDSAKEELKDVFRASGDPFVAQLLAPAPDAPGTSTRATQGRGRSTVAGFFKSQLVALMTEINSTQPHWIRCVKPHSAKKPRLFHGAEVMTQLRSAGVLETVRIRQQSFAVRLPFAEFAREYLILGRRPPREPAGASTGNFIDARSDPRAICQAILTRANVNSHELAQIGRTKVFLRTEAFYSLSGQRHKLKGLCVTVAAAFIRGRASGWRAACLERNRRVKQIQAWLYFRPSNKALRHAELRAREAFLLVTFRGLLMLQSEEHTKRTRDIEEVESAAWKAEIVDMHVEGLGRLRAEWELAKVAADAASRQAFVDAETSARAVLEVVERDATVSLWRQLHDCALDEDFSRRAIVQDEADSARAFVNAHEEVRAAVAAERQRRLRDALCETEAAECRERVQTLEPAASRAFRHIVFLHRVQLHEAALRDELGADEAAARTADIEATHAARWGLLVERWWQVKASRDAQARRALRSVEKDARAHVALEWLQTLMLLLERLEHDRAEAAAVTAAREEAEWAEQQRRAAEADERERRRVAEEREEHRRKAQFVWQLARREEALAAATRRQHEAAVREEVARHAVAAEAFKAMKVAEATGKGLPPHRAVAAAGSVGRRGRFSAMHFATAHRATDVGRRTRSPNSCDRTQLLAVPTTAAAAAGVALPQRRVLQPASAGTHQLISGLAALAHVAAAAESRVPLPVTVTETGAPPSAAVAAPAGVPRRSASRSPSGSPQSIYASTSPMNAKRRLGRKSIDPFDSNWVPPDSHHAYLPDGAVVCTDVIEVPTEPGDAIRYASPPRLVAHDDSLL